jgi:hypothetical protein
MCKEITPTTTFTRENDLVNMVFDLKRSSTQPHHLGLGNARSCKSLISKKTQTAVFLSFTLAFHQHVESPNKKTKVYHLWCMPWRAVTFFPLVKFVHIPKNYESGLPKKRPAGFPEFRLKRFLRRFAFCLRFLHWNLFALKAVWVNGGRTGVLVEGMCVARLEFLGCIGC